MGMSFQNVFSFPLQKQAAVLKPYRAGLQTLFFSCLSFQKASSLSLWNWFGAKLTTTRPRNLLFALVARGHAYNSPAVFLLRILATIKWAADGSLPARTEAFWLSRAVGVLKLIDGDKAFLRLAVWGLLPEVQSVGISCSEMQLLKDDIWCRSRVSVSQCA